MRESELVWEEVDDAELMQAIRNEVRKGSDEGSRVWSTY